MFGIFKYSACKHEKLQLFGNVHRMKKWTATKGNTVSDILC
jgi:hypothetical protein